MNDSTLYRACTAASWKVIVAMALLPCIASGQSTIKAVPDVIVPLQRVVDSSPSPLGLTNIFFAPPPAEIQQTMRTGDGWSSIEVAAVVEGEGLRTIYAIR